VRRNNLIFDEPLSSIAAVNYATGATGANVNGVGLAPGPTRVQSRPRRIWLPVGAVAATTQTAVPTSDISAGTWTPSAGAVLYDMVDDSSDTTYIRSATGAGPDACTLALGTLSTPGAGTVTLRVRHRATP